MTDQALNDDLVRRLKLVGAAFEFGPDDAATAQEAAARITALTEEVAELRRALEWQPIETAPNRTPVIIAVPNADKTDFIVGEAYFDPENYPGGDWWWAGSDYGDYHAGPISEVNHHGPSHWRALPPAPLTALTEGQAHAE